MFGRTRLLESAWSSPGLWKGKRQRKCGIKNRTIKTWPTDLDIPHCFSWKGSTTPQIIPNSHLSMRIGIMKFCFNGWLIKRCLLAVNGGEGWIWHSAPHSRCCLSLFGNNFWRDTCSLIAGKARRDQKPVYLRMKSEHCTWNSITWDQKLPPAFSYITTHLQFQSAL